jgi:hypothetical protein
MSGAVGSSPSLIRNGLPGRAWPRLGLDDELVGALLEDGDLPEYFGREFWL